jgi:tRNA(His) 5'-end guanylyltransferase
MIFRTQPATVNPTAITAALQITPVLKHEPVRIEPVSFDCEIIQYSLLLIVEVYLFVKHSNLYINKRQSGCVAIVPTVFGKRTAILHTGSIVV